MGEKPASKHPLAFTLVPVALKDQYKRQPPVQQLSWWSLCTRWLQYHAIQLSWDIERQFARLFHRRWGA